jgi:hypothetical protein
MVTEIASAVEAVAKVAYEVLHKDKQNLIDEAYAEAKADVKQAKDVLLANDYVSFDLLSNGLLLTIPVDLSATEYQLLKECVVNDRITKKDLLAYYEAGRGASLAARICEIVQYKE